MTVGAVVLMSLSNNAPSAGPFCLSTYYRLDPISKAVTSRLNASPDRWQRIEIHYSGTRAGNLEQLASLSGLASPDDLNCHFVIGNGVGAVDGHIRPTEKWQKQWSITPDETWYGTRQTIRICLIADGKTTFATDCQVRRAEALVESLCRKFKINAANTFYPSDWR
jgi:hypothetical protein